MSDPQNTYLILLHAAGQAIAAESPMQQTVENVISIFRSTLFWDYGAFWHEDEQTHQVSCLLASHAPFLDGCDFAAMSRDLSFMPGPGGLVRTVLKTRESLLIEDIAKAPGLRRGEAAVRAGLKSAFAFPLIAGGQVLGVLEFFAREPRYRNERLLMAAANIGILLGEFIVRRQAEDRYRELVELSPDAIIVHCEGRHVFANQAAARILGASDASQILGKDAFFVLHPDWEHISRARVQKLYEGRDEVPRIELKFVRLDGETIDVEIMSRYFIYGGKPAIQSIFRDITARKRFEERLAFLAQYDGLIGLPNRALFYDRLRQAVVRAKREHGMVGLLFLDLDRFKLINDSLGHAAGDRVLKVVADRLKGFLREVDTIARLGGDEFTVIIEGVSDAEQVASVAEKIKVALGESVVLDGHNMLVSASIGITLYPRDAEDIEHLVKNADIAMYHAKRRGGRQQFQFYDAGMAPLAAGRLELEARLKHAIENREFLLHYQPTVDVLSGRITGMEALIRWHSPGGMIPPADFIPLAEESGLILDIGKLVLYDACTQTRAWQREGLPPLRLAVNLSPLQFRQENLLETVSEILRETGLAPDYLELEITENAIMDRSGQTIATLNRLEELGVHLSIDDFGTGYSSLAYLKQFPVHQLKIDRSFVRDVTMDSDDAAIVSAMIAMSRSLGLRVTAEGVETRQQLEFLRKAGCDTYQGFYFSVPLPARAFAELIRKQAEEDR